MVTAAGARTWLVYDIETKDEREDAEVGLGATAVPLEQFITFRQQHTAITGPVDETSFPAPPDVSFLGFIETTINLLPPQDAALIIDRYRAGRDAIRQRLQSMTDIKDRKSVV